MYDARCGGDTFLDPPCAATGRPREVLGWEDGDLGDIGTGKDGMEESVCCETERKRESYITDLVAGRVWLIVYSFMNIALWIWCFAGSDTQLDLSCTYTFRHISWGEGYSLNMIESKNREQKDTLPKY